MKKQSQTTACAFPVSLRDRRTVNSDCLPGRQRSTGAIPIGAQPKVNHLYPAQNLPGVQYCSRICSIVHIPAYPCICPGCSDPAAPTARQRDGGADKSPVRHVRPAPGPRPPCDNDRFHCPVHLQRSMVDCVRVQRFGLPEPGLRGLSLQGGQFVFAQKPEALVSAGKRKNRC